MTKITNTYASAHAAAQIDKILAFMNGRQDVTVPQLMQLLSAADCTVLGYLRFLRSEGDVHCTTRASHYQGGRHPAKWALGPAPGGRKAEVDSMPRTVKVCKQWTGKVPPMFEPMAHLFGRAA